MAHGSYLVELSFSSSIGLGQVRKVGGRLPSPHLVIQSSKLCVWNLSQCGVGQDIR